MSDIKVDKSDGILTVSLNIPPVNALKLANYAELERIFTQVNETEDVNCVVFTAEGNRAFCAGMDLNEFRASSVEEDPARAAVVRSAFKAVRLCPVPVIGAINGPALGAGAVLASVCDIRVASEKATFGMPEIDVGRCGGGAHMGRLLSPGMLRLMYFTGEPISAWEAYRIGLVEQVVAPKRLNSAAYELAGIIASKSAIGLRMAKEALNRVEFMPVEEGYALEQEYSTRLMAINAKKPS